MANDAPPAYEEVTSGSHHRTRNGIPPQSRRSMEDEGRPLPRGWVRQFDPDSKHQFFVDTTADPPRSIWHHPYDDAAYLSTLPSEERERVEGIHGLHRTASQADVEAESSADDGHGGHLPGSRPSTADPAAPPTGLRKLGRKMKDKMTSSTHEQREALRQRRALDEQRAYEAHQAYRRAMLKAMETGKPQVIGRDRQGREVYVEPPQGYGGYAYGGGGGQYYSPYSQGQYANPNVRFIRPPPDPYYRPYGCGYGGGLGVPLMGGLLGGAMLGGLLF